MLTALKNFVPYNEPYQSRERVPDAYEDLFGDALEAAFARGVSNLESLVTVFVERAVPSPGAEAWTTDLLRRELARLGT